MQNYSYKKKFEKNCALLGRIPHAVCDILKRKEKERKYENRENQNKQSCICVSLGSVFGQFQ
jgi:hypothetical protein